MKLKTNDFTAEISLNDTETAKAIETALPLGGNAQVWQEELYFEIPVEKGVEDGTGTVEPGDVTYWPTGRCFCVFYGQSQPVGPVTVIGKVKTNLNKFPGISNGEKIRLDRD